jgi:hypothetical protein
VIFPRFSSKCTRWVEGPLVFEGSPFSHSPMADSALIPMVRYSWSWRQSSHPSTERASVL